MILAALKRWKEAEEWFEICASAPAQVPSAIQMEALKKLTIVQLIWRGGVRAFLFVTLR
jgi:COP9 signalosome complex subunit 3